MKDEFALCVRELFLAREYFAKLRGQRKDPNAPDYIDYTWKDYCEEIGISCVTANNWTKRFIPREVTPNGKDYCLGPVPPGFTAAVWWLQKKAEQERAERRGA